MAKKLFQPGQSGNPGGRKRDSDVVKWAQMVWETEGRERLLEIMRQKKDNKTALKAVQTVLERAYGKVPQAVTSEDGGPVQFKITWIRDGKDD